MNGTRDVDLVLRAYLADDGSAAPDHVLDAVSDRIGRQPQRRSWPFPGRTMTVTPLKLVAALAAAIIFAVVGYNLLPRQSSVGGQPTPSPSAAPTPSAPSAAGATQRPDPLAGTWTSAPSTCADQNAALQRAGFTPAQLTLGGWDAATCIGMRHGSLHRIFFLKGAGVAAQSGTLPDGRLQQYADGELGWDGYYVIVDGDTFVAGDGGRAPYLTYQFSIQGDQLVIDMVKNELPAPTEADLLGDSIAQTVIYESGPFTRVP